MNVLKIVSAATAVALTTLVSTTVASSVTLFDDINFSGASFHVDGVRQSHCYSFACFNDRASSATWSDLPEQGAAIMFYKDIKCQGGVIGIWYTTEPNKPSNFAIDGMNDAASSFKVMQNGEDIKARHVNACRSTEADNVVASNNTAVATADNTTRS